MHAFEAGFFGNGDRAWHNLGTVIPDDVVSVERAFQLVPELASAVYSRPLAYRNPDGTYTDFTSEVANVREMDGKVVGVVSPDYKIIEPWRGARFIDDLLQAGDLACHTGGTVKGGRQWWMLFRMPEDVLIGGHADENVVPFVMITNSFDRSMSFTIAMTPVRVVCWNTIQAGLSRAARTWSASHNGDLDGKLIDAAKVLGLTRTYYQEFAELGNNLIRVPWDVTQMRGLVDRLTVFQPPKEADTDRKAENRDAAKQAIVDYFQFAPNLVDTAANGTAWAAYNAVAEYSDWDRISRKTKAGDTAGQSQFARIINDTTMKDEALSLILS